MIRIPTGPVSKNTARTLSILAGLAAIGLSFIPALAPFSLPLREFGIGATGLGTALGK
jgi:4-hydroxybenzoate polyprenyltransferase